MSEISGALRIAFSVLLALPFSSIVFSAVLPVERYLCLLYVPAPVKVVINGGLDEQALRLVEEDGRTSGAIRGPSASTFAGCKVDDARCLVGEGAGPELKRHLPLLLQQKRNFCLDFIQKMGTLFCSVIVVTSLPLARTSSSPVTNSAGNI